jgi:hypothetical protein
MKTTILLETLRARGVVVEAPDADRLRIEAPRGTLSAADVAELKRLKPELLALLAGPELPGIEAPGEPLARPSSVYARDLYDPEAAREYALSVDDEVEGEGVQARLLAFADEAEALEAVNERRAQ